MTGDAELAKAEQEVKRLLGQMSPLDTAPLEARVRERLGTDATPMPFLRPGLRLRPVALLTLGTAAAGAALLVGATWFTAEPRESSPRGLEVVPAPRTEASGGARQESAPSGPPPQEQAAPPASPPPAARLDPQANGVAPAAQKRSSSASISTENLLYEAARALRHRGEAWTALQLLDEHRRRTAGEGEEALALRIEALRALGSPKATAAAERYLSTYPSGRYKRLAESAAQRAQGE